MDVDGPRIRKAPIQTDEDTVGPVRRSARHHLDAVIAGFLNRWGKTTAYGHPLTANRIENLRRYWD